MSTTEVGNVLTDLDFIHDANIYGVTIPGNIYILQQSP